MGNWGFIMQEPPGNGVFSKLGDEELGIYPLTPRDHCLRAASGSAPSHPNTDYRPERKPSGKRSRYRGRETASGIGQ